MVGGPEGEQPLRLWQQEALEAWKSAGNRGIVAAATGTGKTRVALSIIERALERGDRVVIVVPKKILADQWVGELRRKLRLGPNTLGTLGGNKPSFRYEHRVVVSVINSARTRLSDIVSYWQSLDEQVLLIIDECHWAGSEQSRGLFETPADYTLGLSATPERGDDGYDEILVPGLGPVVYRYALRDALDDGLLAPVTALNVYIDLSPWERSEYGRLVDDLRRVLEDERGLPEGIDPSDPALPKLLSALSGRSSAAKKAERLMSEQRRLLASSPARVSLLAELCRLGVFAQRRSLVFNETIQQAEDAHRLLSAEGLAVVMDHSKMPVEQRERAHRLFAAGSADCLVAVRTVDEGVDVPDADLAVITSGTLNPRQRIQRIGRVVRPKAGGAAVVSLLAKGTAEESVGLRDEALLGPERVRHLRQPADVASALREMTSSMDDRLPGTHPEPGAAS